MLKSYNHTVDIEKYKRIVLEVFQAFIDIFPLETAAVNTKEQKNL